MDLTLELSQYDTAEISDALDSCGIEGALLGIKALTPGTKIIGPAFTVKYTPYHEKQTEFKNAGNYIDDVPPNSVIIIDNGGRQDCTTWGDILTQVAVTKKLSGTVIFGAARDANMIRKMGYPLFSSSLYMRSGKNRVFKSDQQCKLRINDVQVCPGDIVVGDDDGVVIVPKNRLAEIIVKVRNIRRTEEQIITSVQSGMRLDDARKIHKYDQPWLNSRDKA